MSNQSIELTGKYLGEVFRFNNSDGTTVIVGKILLSKASKPYAVKADLDPDAPLAIKGEADPNELEYNRTYRFFGTWNSYFNKRRQEKEKQFAFRSFAPHIPHDEDGLVDYLTHAGRGNGI